MSRRRLAKRRNIKPDSKYDSVLLSIFINNLMKSGKKSLSERITYGSLEKIRSKYNSPDVLKVFQEAINNVRPEVEVKPVRVGGATYQVPVAVDDKRGSALAVRWVINASLKYSGNTMIDKLSECLFDSFNKKGNAIKKREEVHKIAESNKAFSHFANNRNYSSNSG